MIRAGLSFNFTYRLLSPLYDRACFLQHPNTLRHYQPLNLNYWDQPVCDWSIRAARLTAIFLWRLGPHVQRHPVSGRRSSGMKVVVIYDVFVGLSNDPSLPDWRLLLPQRLRCLVSIFIVDYTFSSIPIVSSYTYPQSQTQLFCIMNAVMM